MLELLREKHSKQEYALLEKVANETGQGNRRTADALAMSLWPSRGLYLHGFEIKSVRGDWLKELSDPSKAEAIASYCHFWWIVAPDGLIDRNELPEDWDLLVPDSQKGDLKIKIKANKRDPAPISYKFLASLFRQAQRQLADEARVERARHQGYEQGLKKGRHDGRKRKESEYAAAERENERFRETLEPLAEALGKEVEGLSRGDIEDIKHGLVAYVVEKKCSRSTLSKMHRIKEIAKQLSEESEWGYKVMSYVFEKDLEPQ